MTDIAEPPGSFGGTLRALAREPLSGAAFAVYVGAFVILALVKATEASTAGVLRAWIDPVLLALTVLGLLWGRSQLRHRERRFWDLLALAWCCWLSVELIYFSQLETSFVSASFLSDSLYLLYYFIFALAVDSRPHESRDPTLTAKGRRLESIAGLATVFGMLLYFALVVSPELGVTLSFVPRSGGHTPFLLVRLSLDALLLGRLAFVTLTTHGRWRYLYGLLGLGVLGYALRHTFVFLRYEQILLAEPGLAGQALLYLPGLIIFVAARSRHVHIGPLADTGRQATPIDGRELPRPSAIALYALVVPAVHFLLYPMGFLDEASHTAREVFSLGYVLVLGTMAWIHQRVLTLDTLNARAALHEAEERLSSSRKLESVGRLAGGIAHDFNNYLTVIQGYGELLRERLQGTPEAADLEYVRDAAEKATHLTRQLLAFGRRQVLHPEALNLNEVIRETSKMLDSLLGEDVELDVDLDPGAGLALADLGQTEQVLVNLAINGRDAMPSGGTLTIRSKRAVIDSKEAAELEVEPGSYLSLLVTDTGVGMSEEVRSQVFEPFFTTKEVGRGTGLGLSTVYGIVTQSRGAITIDSTPRQGTTVRVLLPAAPPRAREASVASPPIPRMAANATLLLVEDEDAVRRLAASALSQAGFTVLSASNGTEAIDRHLEECSDIDLLVTDVLMPGMDGVELAARFQTRAPGLRVLFISGYPADTLRERQKVLPESVRLLQKPFSPSTLVEEVNEALDDTSTLIVTEELLDELGIN